MTDILPLSTSLDYSGRKSQQITGKTWICVFSKGDLLVREKMSLYCYYYK